MRVWITIAKYTGLLAVTLVAAFLFANYLTQGTQAQEAPPAASPGAPAKPAAPAPATTPAAAPANLAVPSPEQLLVLIRTSLIALNQANQTGNYTTLHDLSAPAMQAANTPAQMAASFATLRSQGIDLSPVVVITPKVLAAPEITQQGLLHIVGFFPTQPLIVKFELLFQPVANQWRLFGVSVNAAPPPPEQAKAEAAPPAAAAPAPADPAATTATVAPPDPAAAKKAKTKAGKKTDPAAAGTTPAN